MNNSQNSIQEIIKSNAGILTGWMFFAIIMAVTILIIVGIILMLEKYK